jgi:predicted MFS family arabinose efflux permease
MQQTRSEERGPYLAVSVALCTCLFAGQAALIAMSPVLAQAASELHVTTAAAGQLRTVTGLAAGTTALLLGVFGGRIGLARQLLGACALLAFGSLASAAAPGFALLALAQLPVGIAVAALTTGATLAAAEWVSPEARTRTLSWALVGQPAAWIVGMPVLGLVGGHSWRYGWLAVPLVAAILAAVLIAPRARQRPATRRPARARAALENRLLARWLASELLYNSAWAGTLVYSGALFAESYGSSAGLTGVLLALAACANVAGNMTSRRLVTREPIGVLVVLALVLAAGVALFGLVRVHPALSTALFSLTAFVAGGRTLVTSTFALAAPPELRPAVTSLRAATMQFGYFSGSLAGGLALVAGGYGALGATMGILFLGTAALLVNWPVRRFGTVIASLAFRHGFPAPRPARGLRWLRPIGDRGGQAAGAAGHVAPALEPNRRS